MYKNILITGSGGFIGRNLKEYLQNDYCLFAPRSYELDLTNHCDVKRYLFENEINLVIHCASIGVARGDFHDDTVDTNCLMFKNILSSLSPQGRIINMGSGAEYDKSLSMRKIEEADFRRSIPADPYGYSKYLISEEIGKHDNVLNLRLFGVYGQFEHQSRFPTYAIMKNLYKEDIVILQNVVFDYLFIDDLCRVVQFFIENETSNKFINVTPDISIDLVSIAEIINSFSTFKSKIIVVNPQMNNEYTGSNSLLKSIFHDIYFTSYEHGLSKLYNSLITSSLD